MAIAHPAFASANIGLTRIKAVFPKEFSIFEHPDIVFAIAYPAFVKRFSIFGAEIGVFVIAKGVFAERFSIFKGPDPESVITLPASITG